MTAIVSSNLPAVSWGKRLYQALQAGLAFLIFALVRLMPLSFASALGGWLGQTIGPHLGITKKARNNLERAFPEKTTDEINYIIRRMWNNFGRVAFEFPLLHRMRFGEVGTPGVNVEVEGYAHTDQLRDDDQPGIFLSAHLGNWELAGRSIILRGIPLHLIYRLPNNPMTVKLLMNRNPGDGEMIPKGARGAKRAIGLLKSGEHLGIMADQKMNNGIAVPFFGRDAMTAPAMAQFGLRFKCPIVPVRVERLEGVKFKITHYPPMRVKDTGNKQADIHAFMVEVNELLESWIRERPEQWLWLHKRWPKG